MATNQECHKCGKIYPKKDMTIMRDNKTVLCPECIKERKEKPKQTGLFLPPHR